MSSNPNAFHLGLCLAGAISAGAYTAGVIDYLIEALEEWQKRKATNAPNTPSHQVVISVIGGASAGGMTGIITASAINQPYFPMANFPQPLGAPQLQNKLYHSWVDLVEDDMFPRMLKTDDIKPKQIYSLLNASFIDEIANRILQIDSALPWIYPKYINDNLKIFTTLSNLEGFEYDVAFKSNLPNGRYIMSIHNDYASFVLNKNANQYDHDGWIPLNFQNSLNTSIARDAAMATGAFPIGLRARTVNRDTLHVNENRWLRDIFKQKPLTDPFIETINVDGGLINNEPFEKVQDLLRTITGESPQENQDYHSVKSTIVMVDPFPSEEGKFDNSDLLTTVMGNTLSSMISQMRVKKELLEDALDSTKSGQFLIAPTRPDPDSPGEKLNGSRAIACGTLGGFGGFLHKDFRIHDFFLGRANCERFLRHYFTVPPDTTNAIFLDGYNGVTDKTPFTSPIGHQLQIIPLFTTEKQDITLPMFARDLNWPVLKEEQVDRFRPMIKKRTQTLLMNMDDYRWDTRFLLWMGAKVVLNRKLADAVLKKIKGSLKEYRLLHGK